MSSNWKPWWEKVGEMSTPGEREQFLRGVGGASAPSPSSNILLAIIAGYVGGKIAQRTGNKK